MKAEEFQPSKKFNVGLIGTGGISEMHMFAYKCLKNVNVIAVSDIIHKKAKNLAEGWGVDNVFTDYRDLLKIKDLDLVDICTPVHTHAAIACDAAEYGHDILLEKPMALSTVECEKIIKESEKHNVNLCINHHALFYSSIRKAKSLLDAGNYDLRSFKVSFRLTVRNQLPTWSLKPEFGGLIWEVGTHGAYLELFFLPDIIEVYAVGKKSDNDSLYDNFAVLLRTSDDISGVMEYFHTSNQRQHFCEISYGNGKKVEINLRHDTLIDKSKYQPKWYLEFYYDEIDLLRSWLKWAFRTLAHQKKGIEHINSKLFLMGSYLKSIENNALPPVTPQQGRDTIKLLECIRKSLDTHQVVPFQRLSNGNI